MGRLGSAKEVGRQQPVPAAGWSPGGAPPQLHLPRSTGSPGTTVTFTAGDSRFSKSREYRVGLGEYDRAKEDGFEQFIPVHSEDIFVHPKWFSICAACG